MALYYIPALSVLLCYFEKVCVTKKTEKADSGLPNELSTYQYFPFSGNLTEMLNWVNPLKKSTWILNVLW